MKNVLLIFTLISGLAASMAAFAEDDYSPFRDLKAQAVARFLAQANDPTSAIGQIIAQHNLDTTDGRNQEGTIALPVTEGALQVVVVSGEEVYRPFHYAHRENGRCNAQGGTANFLIALRAITGVHAATDYDSLLFTTSVRENLSIRSTHTDEEMTCEFEFFEDEGGQEAPLEVEFQVGEFARVQLRGN